MTGQEARDDEREALARYPEDHKTIGGNAAQRRAFLAGVEYARKHPEPEITDEMVERAALKVFADNCSDRPDMERAKRRWDHDPEHHMATYGAQARAYLEAALRGPIGEGEQSE